MHARQKLKQRLEQKERALYIRLPHRIQSEQDVAKFFSGEFKVELLRQSSRYCYVIFASVEEKLKNLEAVKKSQLKKKRVIIAPAITKIKNLKSKKLKKKVVYPEIKPETRVTKSLFVSNIKCGIKLSDLKAAIPGCVSGKLLKAYSPYLRTAIIKMESTQIAAEYLTKIRPIPILAGKKLGLYPDTRKRTKKPDVPLKIYDGEKEITDIFSKTNNNNALDHIVLENKQ
ncbi:uncharacterized protein LOC117220190 [Megalopta genalis]|uniref:uncharacterized protein LOC117220190 n=1 Tax=Megalopta genalis TaxID=115081 RepID=UPI003FD10B4F